MEYVCGNNTSKRKRKELNFYKVGVGHMENGVWLVTCEEDHIHFIDRSDKSHGLSQILILSISAFQFHSIIGL